MSLIYCSLFIADELSTVKTLTFVTTNYEYVTYFAHLE